jgi:hypothetical protein
MSGGEKENHIGLMVVCVLIGKGMPLGRGGWICLFWLQFGRER